MHEEGKAEDDDEQEEENRKASERYRDHRVTFGRDVTQRTAQRSAASLPGGWVGPPYGCSVHRTQVRIRYLRLLVLPMVSLKR